MVAWVWRRISVDRRGAFSSFSHFHTSHFQLFLYAVPVMSPILQDHYWGTFWIAVESRGEKSVLMEIPFINRNYCWIQVPFSFINSMSDIVWLSVHVPLPQNSSPLHRIILKPGGLCIHILGKLPPSHSWLHSPIGLSGEVINRDGLPLLASAKFLLVVSQSSTLSAQSSEIWKDHSILYHSTFIYT